MRTALCTRCSPAVGAAIAPVEEAKLMLMGEAGGEESLLAAAGFELPAGVAAADLAPDGAACGF